MKKRLVAMLLSFALILSCLAGCGSEASEPAEQTPDATTNAPQETATVVDKEIPVDYYAGTEITIYYQQKDTDGIEDINEKPIIKAAEEATGIHVNWIVTDTASMSTKTPTILSGDDRPDAYWWTVDSATIAANPGLFYDLSEDGLLETYAPNVVRDYEEIGTVWDTITWADGSIYSLATGWTGHANDALAVCWTINQNWLDAVNMEMPTNQEELLAVLRAFKNNDVDGDGDNSNQIPIGFCNNHWAGHLLSLADFWGLGGSLSASNKDHYFQIKDGKVVGTVDTDMYRDFLEFLHICVEEGLIDVEGFTQTSDQYNAKINSDTYGMYTCWNPDVNKMDYLVPMGVVKAYEGVDPVYAGKGFTGVTYGTNFVIDADTENVEAVLHWWNWLSKDKETKWMVRRGNQGDTWEMDAEGNVYTIPSAEQKFENQDYYDGFHNGCPVLTPSDLTEAKGVPLAAASQWHLDAVELVRDYIVKEPKPVRFTTAEFEEERTFIETDLIAYIGNFTATAAMNGITDADWETHLEALEDYGYYDWIQWYQDYLDKNY